MKSILHPIHNACNTRHFYPSILHQHLNIFLAHQDPTPNLYPSLTGVSRLDQQSNPTVYLWFMTQYSKFISILHQHLDTFLAQQDPTPNLYPSLTCVSRLDQQSSPTVYLWFMNQYSRFKSILYQCLKIFLAHLNPTPNIHIHPKHLYPDWINNQIQPAISNSRISTQH